jgi:transposase
METHEAAHAIVLAEAARPTELARLADAANTEHRQVLQLAATALDHATRCGEALIAAHDAVTDGDWEVWLAQNFEGDRVTAYRYIRIAAYKDRLAPHTARGGVSLRRGLQLVSHLPRVGGEGGGAQPSITRDETMEVQRLLADGWTKREVAAMLGVGQHTVNRRANPVATRAADKRRRHRARAARHALRREEVAAEATGGSLAEAYSLLRRLAQELDRTEIDSRELRAHVSAALGFVHRAEDELVKALGIAP